MRVPDWLERLRRWLNPETASLRWTPFLWLIYLGYLFFPFIWVPPGHRLWVWLTLASIPVFLALYAFQWHTRWHHLRGLFALALLSYLLTPFNPTAFTYLTYAAAAAPLAGRGLTRGLAITTGLLLVQVTEALLLGQGPIPVGVALFVCLAVCLGNHFMYETLRKNAALKLSQEEVRRLAMMAERERIGRDLHDLLGHTLSLIAIKSELAGKLMHRDRGAAACEIEEVTAIARDALKQVRTAVTGIRTAALAGELFSAQALLQSCGVELVCCCDEAALPAETETALAMIVREATTNIQRHAHASHARIEVQTSHASGAPTVTLTVQDDGRGGAGIPGNGLKGISERVKALGGSLELDSPRGSGTRLCARWPLTDSCRVAGSLVGSEAVG